MAQTKAETMMSPTLQSLHSRLTALEQLIHQKYPLSIRAQKLYIAECAIESACEEFDFNKDYLLSDKRPADVSWARQVAMSLAYEKSGLSSHELAFVFGREDHGTILHAYRIVHQRSKNGRSKQEVEAVRFRLEIKLGEHQ